MCKKMTSLFSFMMVLSLSVSIQAAVMTFHETEPTPGPDDIYNFVGTSRDANNVGTYDYDTWLNNETTYIADDRPAQGQTFVTGSSEPVYLLTGVWIRHCGYTDSTATGTANNGTWYSMPAGSEFGIRITNPAASGTSNFVLSRETYSVTRSEPNSSLMPTGATGTANGTGTWFHFVLDTPVVVGPNTTYGFDVVSVAGGSNMFLEMLGIKDDSPNPPGNPYTSGTAYTSGAGGVANNALTVAPGDRVFLIELVGAPPATASIPNPSDNATGMPTAPVLSWNAGFDSTESKVYFGASPDSLVLEATIPHMENVDRYNHPVTGLGYNQVYYWRVDQGRQTGGDIVGDIWSFTTGTIKASDPSPYNNEIAVVVDTSLNWKAGLDSTESKVYFGTNQDALELQTTITHTEGVDQYSYQVTGLTNDLDYYWRVDETLNTGEEVEGDTWQFMTIPVIPVTDPNLVGWWKFDEGQGKAVDWSGLNQHGIVYGNAESVFGYDGDAIQFDGSDDYVDLPIDSTIISLGSTTITTWANVLGTAAWQRIFDFGVNPPPGPDAPTIYMYLTPIDAAGVPSFVITTDGGGNGLVLAASDTLPDGWHHVAVVIDGDDMSVTLYIDSSLVANGPTDILPSDLGDATDNYLGKSKRWENSTGVPDPHLTGSLDDFRIYNYALSQDQINLVMRIDPLRASNPSPGNRTMSDIEAALPLTWSPGDNAVQHDVYFGIDEFAVENADASDTTGIYRGRQTATSYTPDEGVEWGGGPYYWRIDEYNNDETINKGGLWAFTVTDYFVVDDFEDYNDYEPDRIFDAWIDGYGTATNGSTVGYAEPDFIAGEHFVETDIVHNGSQSMPYFYDNDMKYSEAAMTIESGRDWTRQGVEVLSLWHIGYPAYSGSFTEDPAGTFTMTGSGTDIWDTSDEFHFAYKQLTGVGSITARVLSVDNTDSWAKAGVMIRDTLEQGSRYAMMIVTPGQGVSFQNRTDTDGASNSTTAGSITAPQWVKIERDISGNFTASYSDNGSTWTQLGSNIVNMSATAYVGLAVTSHNSGATCEATFSNVTITGNVTQQQWMDQDIGIISNDAERMYVVLDDSAVVYNENPDISLIDEWTEWRINLQEFADQGVDLTNVESVGIGFGERNNPQAGGAGLVFFDDIRLYRP